MNKNIKSLDIITLHSLHQTFVKLELYKIWYSGAGKLKLLVEMGINYSALENCSKLDKTVHASFQKDFCRPV